MSFILNACVFVMLHGVLKPSRPPHKGLTGTSAGFVCEVFSVVEAEGLRLMVWLDYKGVFFRLLAAAT